MKPNAGSGPDCGIDLTLDKGGETFLVQCKRWRATKVGVEVVRELYGAMATRSYGRIRGEFWRFHEASET